MNATDAVSRTAIALAVLGTMLAPPAVAQDTSRPATQRGTVLTGFAPLSDVTVVGERFMPGAPKKVAVAGFVVAFQTNSGAAATASRLGSTGSSRASVNATLTGVDDALMQAITDAAWQDFQTRMQAAGIEIVPVPTELSGQPSPLRGNGIVLFAPTGQRVSHSNPALPGTTALSGFDTRSPFRFVQTLARNDGVVGISVQYIVDFANAASSGGMFAGRARAQVTPALSVRAGSGIGTVVTPRGATCVGYCPGLIGSINLGQAVASTESYGQAIEDNSRGSAAVNALGAVSGMLTGVGMSMSRYEVRANPADYNRIATSLLGEAQGRVVGTLVNAMNAPAR